MDFQFKVTGDSSCDSSNDENEYHMEIEFTSLRFNDEAIEKLQIIFLYGDLMNKTDVHRNKQQSSNDNNNDDEDATNFNTKVVNNDDFCIEKRTYVIHSTPNRLAEKLLEVPIMFLFLTENQEIVGNPILLEVNECFANSIRCNDFNKEALRKTYDITDDTESFGKVSLNFSIVKEIGNSNRFRKFYTESTDQRLKLEAI